MRIFLAGFMGCGKSRFGKRLAIQAGLDFLDTDREIERLAGASIPEIFEIAGEEWFRILENRVIETLPGAGDNIVVALGGGAPCREGVMEALSGAGTTIYMKMSPVRLVERLSEKGRDKRPKISGMDDDRLLAFIERTLPEREKYYNLADAVLDCDAISDEQIVGRFLETIKQLNGQK